MHRLTRLTLCFGLAFALLGGVQQTLAEAVTRVLINGRPTPVHFNDGDSFRVLAGPLDNTKARLAGFNTLESYGPVHRWGDWTAKELYFLAKMGTLNARKGVWTCTTDMKRDGYGRLLLDCPDLIKAQVRAGLAHTLTITENPAPEEYLEAQREAQAEKRGIWAHGIPEYVLTSTHSAAEEFDGGAPYNRLVSTVDGHSKRWTHDNTYDECEDVCYVPVRLDPAKVTAAAEQIKLNPKLSKGLEDVEAPQLAEAITDFVNRTGLWPKELIPQKLWAPLAVTVDRMRESGALGELVPEEQACMIYIDFRRRYGPQRAACLD